MTFLNPAFAWGFLSLPLILALYLLKRRYEEKPVPSTFLWRKAGLDASASRPFQRLRRNRLLPIQLLMAAVMVLGLMRPVIAGGSGGELVMIFDLSASMQATENGRTRLEQAVADAQTIISGLGAQDALTILASDGGIQQLLSRSTDRDAAYRALRNLEPVNRECDLSGAVALAQAMEREIGALEILVFSDDYVPPPGVSTRNAPHGLENRAVVSFEVEDGAGYARVANYGPEADVTLACYAEGTLCDARTLRIPEGETAGVALDVPDCRWAYVELQQSDALAADDRLYQVARIQQSRTVALCGETSLFLERAVGLRDDLKVIKISDEERAEVAADLYIYGESPLIFSLDADSGEIAAGEEREAIGAPALLEAEGIASGLTLSGVAVRTYRPLEGGTAYMEIDGQCVLAAAGRTVALGFDVHDSNLPMKYDFPILVQNILRALLPEDAAEVGDGICGDSIRIPLPADFQSAQVTLPGGRVVSAGDGMQWSDPGFSDTEEAGLYALSIDGEERWFSLRMPASQSDVRFVAPSVDAAGASASFAGGAELTGWLAALFLALLMMEWEVRRHVA